MFDHVRNFEGRVCHPGEIEVDPSRMAVRIDEDVLKVEITASP